MTPEEIGKFAAHAGFRGDGLVKAIAVALAESGGNPRATNTNTDKYRSVDRGLWQINSHWHPEVSAAQAFDPYQSAQAAFRISKGGRDWSQWSTWPLAAGAQMGRARLAAGKAAQVTVPVNAPEGTKPSTTPNTPTPSTATPAGWKDWLADQLVDPEGLNTPGPGHVPWNTFTAPGDMLGAASQVVALIAKGGAWVADSHNWKRIAFVVGGGAALLIGAQQLAASGSLGSTAAGVGAIPGKAAGLIPAGKIAKAAKAVK